MKFTMLSMLIKNIVISARLNTWEMVGKADDLDSELKQLISQSSLCSLSLPHPQQHTLSLRCISSPQASAMAPQCQMSSPESGSSLCLWHPFLLSPTHVCIMFSLRCIVSLLVSFCNAWGAPLSECPHRDTLCRSPSNSDLPSNLTRGQPHFLQRFSLSRLERRTMP